MAIFELFAAKLLHLEGGYVNHPADKGGPTKYGVILSTWRAHGYDKDGDGAIDAEDVKLITEADARGIAKRIFWDYFQADKIDNQSIAELIVDWGYNSGTKSVARIVQRLLNVQADGLFGPITLHAINVAPKQQLFERIKSERLFFINGIAKRDPSQAVFIKGWRNRIHSFEFSA